MNVWNMEVDTGQGLDLNETNLLQLEHVTPVNLYKNSCELLTKTESILKFNVFSKVQVE